MQYHRLKKYYLGKLTLVMLIIALGLTCINGKSIYVSSEIGDVKNSGSNYYNTESFSGPLKYIQAAINKSSDGDTIYLMKGNYYEKIIISGKHNLTILAFGNGLVNIFGSYRELRDHKKNNWSFIRKEKNSYHENEQYIYKLDLPQKGIKETRKLPDYYAEFNQLYDRNGQLLFGYRKWEGFEKRNAPNSNGEAYLFTDKEIYLAINHPINERFNNIHATISGFTIRILGCKNLHIDGGKDNLIHIKYGGRYSIGAEGYIDGLSIKNLTFSQTICAIYLFNIKGNNAYICNNSFVNKLDQNWSWAEIKASLLETSGIVYANGKIQNLIVSKNYFEGLFNGVISIPGNTDINNNVFKNIWDDAVELEGLANNIKVSQNFLFDCFVSFSLCPVEEGPVYIFQNIVYNQRKYFPYKIFENGTIRKVKPRTLKFWNQNNGLVKKDGKKMKVSQNCHFYYNTIISTSEPFSIGNYGKKYLSPINSTFYNNIFYSDGILTYSTGFAKDGIDIDNNIFYSSLKDKSEPRLFIGWDGKNHYRTLQNTNSWTDNQFIKVEYDNEFSLCKKSKKRVLKSYNLKLLPDHYPGSEYLNQRTLPGYQKETND